jgi:hypothetical protein
MILNPFSNPVELKKLYRRRRRIPNGWSTLCGRRAVGFIDLFLEVSHTIGYFNYINLRNGLFSAKAMQHTETSQNLRSLFDLKRAFLYSNFFRSTYAYIS